MEKAKRKFKDTPTTEILDFLAKEIPYTDDKGRDKQNDMKEELEQRAPFEHIKDKIESQDRRIKQLEEAVEKLLQHSHASDGSILVPISAQLNGRRFG